MIAVPLLVLLAQTVPTSQPSDPTMDWLLSQPTTSSKSVPTTVPTSQPFVDRPAEGELSGSIKLNNGKELTGILSTTPSKPIRVWNEDESRYEDIPFDQITQMQAIIVWERDEKEWRFKESGSDIKVFTGKTYPARELKYKITTLDGQTRTGGVVAPIYLLADGKTTQYVLHKRDKGEIGKQLNELVYVAELKLNTVKN